MAETDTGVAQGGLGKIIGDAVIAFNHVEKLASFISNNNRKSDELLEL